MRGLGPRPARLCLSCSRLFSPLPSLAVFVRDGSTYPLLLFRIFSARRPPSSFPTSRGTRRRSILYTLWRVLCLPLSLFGLFFSVLPFSPLLFFSVSFPLDQLFPDPATPLSFSICDLWSIFFFIVVITRNMMRLYVDAVTRYRRVWSLGP